MKRARLVAAAVWAATFGSGTSSVAGLGHDVDLLVARLSPIATVTRLRPRVYSGGTVTALPLPPRAVSPDADGCTKVVVLGAASAAFALRIPAGSGEVFFPSVAGAAEISRCGAERAALSDVLVELHSPRAVIETVLASSPRHLPVLRALLPDRDPGAVLPPRRPGPSPSPPPLASRADAMERRFREDGAVDVDRRLAATDSSGTGHLLVDLGAGCHFIAALGVGSGTEEGSFHDIDAELDWASGELSAVDRTASPDATLLACNARRALGVLAVSGSGPELPVMLVHARRDFPAGVAERWGDGARARIAKALVEQSVPRLPAAPMFEAFGAGATMLPVEIVPGECYVGAVAPLQSGAKLVTLSASAGAVRAVSHTEDPSSAAVVAFCTGEAERATLDVDVHSSRAPAWVVALWNTGMRRLGEEAP